MPNHNKKLFLSAVNSEFEAYRQLLAGDLHRPTLDVAVEEDFITAGGPTLLKLDEYIQACDGVVHLIGKATGSIPEAVAVQALLKKYPDFAARLPALTADLAEPDPRLSYTQWEAYLAIYHERPLFIYRPADFRLAECHCPRDARFVPDPAQQQAQEAHYARICARGHDRGQFLNPERLSSAVLRDLVEILPRLKARIDVPPTKLRHVAQTLIGRERELTMLDESWNDSRWNVVVVRGKGGEGKTSLVAGWMAELAAKDWRGAEFVFDHSFYSQGTRDQSSTSADEMIQQALRHFGDPDPLAGSLAGRGARLAGLVAARRGLLVLDGLEPLQYSPGPLHGQLKDPGMAALLRGLAGKNAGLCIVTTREQIDEIRQFYTKTALDYALEYLSPTAGAALLHYAGARRAGPKEIAPDDPELQQASREVQGHALTLFLVGNYLRLTLGGDIRRRDRMKLADADAEYQNDRDRPYGHAFKAIEAYETWFAAGDVEARRQLAILRLLSLFDRPAPADCLTVLREVAIEGLNDSLVNVPEKVWNIALSRLQEIGLATVNESGAVDCHPLIREYFARKLRDKEPAAFQAAHSRLFDHLCQTTAHRPDGLDGLQPLYEAVVHGCLAGRQQEACADVYRDRILRVGGNDGFYSTSQLGAIGADLAAVAAFFDEPWSRVSPNLSAVAHAWLLNGAALSLRALGRLTEALQPLRAGLEMRIQQKDWGNAAISASNVSELELTLGRLTDAVADARQSITYADKSGEAFHRMSKRATAADALHHSCQRSEAGTLFAEAERMQQERQPVFDLLYSLRGFQYCDWLLAPAERAAWQALLRASGHNQVIGKKDSDGHAEICLEVERRAKEAQRAWDEIFTNAPGLLGIALDHLTLARVGLVRVILADPLPKPALDLPHVAAAVNGLRDAGQLDYLPKGLLTAALYHFVRGDAAAARTVLDQAQDIAERGPMPLYLADIFLHRARLFRDKAALAAARTLIQKHGYGRRYEELADAESAAQDWPA